MIAYSEYVADLDEEDDDLPWFAAVSLVSSEFPALEIRGRVDWVMTKYQAVAVLSFPGEDPDQLPALVCCDPAASPAEMIRRLRLGASRLLARRPTDPGPILLPFPARKQSL